MAASSSQSSRFHVPGGKRFATCKHGGLPGDRTQDETPAEDDSASFGFGNQIVGEQITLSRQSPQKATEPDRNHLSVCWDGSSSLKKAAVKDYPKTQPKHSQTAGLRLPKNQTVFRKPCSKIQPKGAPSAPQPKGSQNPSPKTQPNVPPGTQLKCCPKKQPKGVRKTQLKWRTFLRQSSKVSRRWGAIFASA